MARRKPDLFLGTPFGSAINPAVIKQISARSRVLSKRTRSSEEISLLNSNTSWLRISSAASIGGSPDSAKNNILFGGTALTEKKSFLLRQGLDLDKPSTSTYQNHPTDRGIVPMPGITSFSSKYQGLSGVMKTEFTFKCFNHEEFQLFEKLYAKIGCTLLVEYGNSIYINNTGDVISNSEAINTFFKSNLTEQKLLFEIEALRQNSDQNYEASICTISNYSISFQSDGSFDFKISCISKGQILEALKATGAPKPTLAGPGSVVPPLELKQLISGNSPFTTAFGSPASIGTPVPLLGTGIAVNLALKYITPPKEKFKLKLGKGLNLDELADVRFDNSKSPVLDILSFYKNFGTNHEELLSKLNEKYCNMQWNTQDAGIFLQKADSGNFDKDLIYIKLKTWLKIISYTLIPTANGGEKVVRIPYEDLFTRYTTYSNHFALDPSICILPKMPVNENLYTGYRKKNIFTAPNGENIYNIWLETSMLYNTLRELSKQKKENGEVDLITYMQTVLEKVDVNLGGITDLNINYYSKAGFFAIVDEGANKQELLNRTTLQLQGQESIFTNVSMNTKVSSAVATQTAIETRANTSSQLVSSFEGVVDRLKTEIKETTGTPTEKLTDEELEEWKKEQLAISKEPTKPIPAAIERYEAAINKFVGQGQIDKGEFETLTGHYADYAKKEITRLYLDFPAGRLPFELSFTMDGISGISVGEMFRIAPGLVPDYLSLRSSYKITSIAQKITANKWTTEVSSAPQIDMGPSGDRFEEKEDPDLAKALNAEVATQIEKNSETE